MVGTSSPPVSERHRILLVEDDESIRDAFTELLEYEGYALTAYDNGERALEALQEGPMPELILLDMMMPLMGGLLFLEHLRAEPAWRPLPVIVVSATEQEAPEGVLAFIKKPFEPSVLLRLLEHYFQRTQAVR